MSYLSGLFAESLLKKKIIDPLIEYISTWFNKPKLKIKEWFNPELKKASKLSRLAKDYYQQGKYES